MLCVSYNWILKVWCMWQNLPQAAIANHREQATIGVLEHAQVAEGTHLTAAIEAISKKEKRAGNVAWYRLVKLI